MRSLFLLLIAMSLSLEAQAVDDDLRSGKAIAHLSGLLYDDMALELETYFVSTGLAPDDARRLVSQFIDGFASCLWGAVEANDHRLSQITRHFVEMELSTEEMDEMLEVDEAEGNDWVEELTLAGEACVLRINQEFGVLTTW